MSANLHPSLTPPLSATVPKDPNMLKLLAAPSAIGSTQNSPTLSYTPPLTRTASAGPPSEASSASSPPESLRRPAALRSLLSTPAAPPTDSDSAHEATRRRRPAASQSDTPHLDALRAEVRRARALAANPAPAPVDGYSLDIPLLVATARRRKPVVLADTVPKQVAPTVEMLADHLRAGKTIYGVNTGFGGSANVRTSDLENLQLALIQHQNAGVLTCADAPGLIPEPATTPFSTAPNSLPHEWATATMLVRLNTLIRGHSAVSFNLIQNLTTLVDKGVTPLVPLRGTVSASGDLLILSYIAALLQGNPAVQARLPCGSLVTADRALAAVGLEPLTLGPKEGLGLLNGTAASGAVAALVLHKLNRLALVSQAITAFNVEALAGSALSFHPFIARVRPHVGQTEAARNILALLAGSRLATGLDGADDVTNDELAQDRYALRTASQFLGPALEDLALATRQIATELNSTTDNPLLDPATGAVYSGGNFQGMSVTSAMEKSRLAAFLLGKLLFAQTTEMMNPATNRGLPPNLAPDDPSTSFLGKGVDIAAASYAAELAFLAHPVAPGIQSAEMHNQSVNSMALVAARYADTAADVLGMLAASALWASLQAADLRIVKNATLRSLSARACEWLELAAGAPLDADVRAALAGALSSEWDATASMDLRPRARRIAEQTSYVLLRKLVAAAASPEGGAAGQDAAAALADIAAFTNFLAAAVEEEYVAALDGHAAGHRAAAPRMLGRGAAAVYTLARGELALPFHCGRAHDPLKRRMLGGSGMTVGGEVSILFEALDRVADCVVDVL